MFRVSVFDPPAFVTVNETSCWVGGLLNVTVWGPCPVAVAGLPPWKVQVHERIGQPAWVVDVSVTVTL